MKHQETHLTFLDYFRGAAILLVFLTHTVNSAFMGYTGLPWNGWFTNLNAAWPLLAAWPAGWGGFGVAIFFVVSGFCIHLSHERSGKKGFGVFFLRRFFRIYPPYLVALLFFAFVLPLTRLHYYNLWKLHDYPGLSIMALDVVSHLLLLHNFVFPTSINFAFWSIAVEVQLYCLYPLVLWIARRWGWLQVLWITGAFEFGMHGFDSLRNIFAPSFTLGPWYGNSPFIYWFSWSIGAVLADAYLTGKPIPFSRLSFLSCTMLFLTAQFFRPLAPFSFTLVALATVTLMARLLKRDAITPSAQARSNPILDHVRKAGLVSYSAYLIHHPIVREVPLVLKAITHAPVINPGVLFCVTLSSWALVYAISCLFYRFIELPSIAWGKRVIAARYASAPRSQVALVKAP